MTAHAADPQPLPRLGLTKVIDHLCMDEKNRLNLVVLSDLRERAEFGKEKYGVYLHTWNGRDAMMDAYQEVLDAIMYTRQAQLEKDSDIDLMVIYEQTLALARRIAKHLGDRHER